ncbi:MAG TPA: hypothetical protein VK908_14000 [Jiangellales bacterium]|jgi:hypothetical protein|nr:hypothetical protein [Jiangellales bacterium]
MDAHETNPLLGRSGGTLSRTDRRETVKDAAVVAAVVGAGAFILFAILPFVAAWSGAAGAAAGAFVAWMLAARAR